MKLKTSFLSLTALAVMIAAAPKANAVLAAYVHIVKNDLVDTRLHISEVEAFANGVIPDGLGGATWDGLATSTNDVSGSIAFGPGNVYPTLGTTNLLEHGAGATNPNNVLENVGNVWSTGNGIGSNAQYTLDLGGTFDVTTIRMWPRADACCANRWQNLEIQLLDASGNPIPGTLNFHTANTGNVALQFNFSPVPEASSLAFLGLAGAVLLRRRRQA